MLKAIAAVKQEELDRIVKEIDEKVLDQWTSLNS